MKKLETLGLTRLSNLEFGQHTKSIHSNITGGSKSKTIIKDSVFMQYLDELNSKAIAYDKALMQIAKSDETAKIAQADVLRDKAFISMQRYLSAFEHAQNPEQELAYKSLTTLLSKYNGLQNWNYEKESNGLDSLIADLQGDKYSVMASSIRMAEHLDILKSSNDAFKTIFKGRTQEQSSKEIFDVKVLKNDLKIIYEKMINYVLAMANALATEEFNQSLSVINTIRKYYSDMLAKRNSSDQNTAAIVAPSIN